MAWEAERAKFESVFARLAAGLGGHSGDPKTRYSDLGGNLKGVPGSDLAAIWEVLCAILVDSLGVIEEYACQDL